MIQRDKNWMPYRVQYRYRNTNKVPYTCKNTEIKIGCLTIVKETGKFARNNYLKFTEESFMFASHVREVTSKKKNEFCPFVTFFCFKFSKQLSFVSFQCQGAFCIVKLSLEYLK